MKSRAALVLGALALAGLQLHVGGCSDDVLSHVYAGVQLNIGGECLEPVESIDIVSGDAPTAPCKPVCILSQPDDTVPQEVFVSSMCAPYPAYPYELGAANDPRCILGIAAFNRNTLCGADDGGTLNPFVDAAADATPDGSIADTSAPDATDAGSGD